MNAVLKTVGRYRAANIRLNPLLPRVSKLNQSFFLSHKQAPFATGNKHTANVILKMLVVSCLEYR